MISFMSQIQIKPKHIIAESHKPRKGQYLLLKEAETKFFWKAAISLESQ